MNLGDSQLSPFQQEPLSRSKLLAGIGLILPYLVGVGSSLVLGFPVGDGHNVVEEYPMAETVTSNLTILSFVLGLCLCIPFFATLFHDETLFAKTLQLIPLMIGIAFHLVCVAVLSFITFAAMCVITGSELPLP